jgi:heparinase II/III-like protein
MSVALLAARARRIISKPPRYLIERALAEAERELDRWLAPMRERNLDRHRLLHLARATGVDELWQRLAGRAYPAVTKPFAAAALDHLEPGESARVFAAAERACSRTVDVLGSGPIALGTPIDWSYDYRAGMGWPGGFARALDYVNRERPSDVKIPWEISRLQWLIPAGQAYLLSGEERYAGAVRDVLEEWMRANPLAYTVNWACAMEAALRICTWTWLFHVFARSASWADEAFRVRFLAALYLHGDFTHRHIEKGDINGNHYVADLAGLAIAGRFFGDVGEAPRWAEAGWDGLVAELPRQVFADGVDYEASCAYHRLVLELFLWPALFRRALGEEIPGSYAGRVRAMARFTAAYSRPDGTTPLWGDADDARALPFGRQPIGDHRYLVGLAALAFDDAELAAAFAGPRAELAWVFGTERAAMPAGAPREIGSSRFPDGGCYIMRDRGAHVFIDCGPLGLAGRGGHGHNDALSFEAWLEGAPLVTDCGSYVYTASFEARNQFRSTASHNTPAIDGEEINRFVHPDDLWTLHDDARPTCLEWRPDAARDVFVGVHRGYERLGVTVRRMICLDKGTRSLEVVDTVSGGTGRHAVAIPWHLAPGVGVRKVEGGLRLESAGRVFEVRHEADAHWTVDIEPCLVSPSYGVALPSQRLVWRRHAPLPASLRVVVAPLAPDPRQAC